MIAGSVRVMKGIMDECAQTSEDLATFEDWASIFLHPKLLVPTVESNLKSHLPALTLDIKKARKELQLMKMATNNGGSYECDQNSRMGMYKLDKIRSEVPKSAL